MRTTARGLMTATPAIGVLLIGIAVYQFAPLTSAQSAAPSIRASEIVIVDPKGVERVRIGGQLPDAVPGKPRGQQVAGVLRVLLEFESRVERRSRVGFATVAGLPREIHTARLPDVSRNEVIAAMR